MLQPYSRIVSGLALCVLGSVACSGGGGGEVITPPPPGNASYHWMNPVSEGNFLTDVWGPSPTNLFATGGGGIVMRYDGQKWRLTRTPVTENLNAIWGTDASHVWAVGVDGVILFFNGSSWTKQDSHSDKTLNDVWGNWDMDVYAIGQEREILHYDGVAWDTMAVANGNEILYSLWGNSVHDIYATGLGKKLLHFDGSSWGEVQTNASFALNAVWGTGPSDVFAVGGGGAAVHWDGLAWNNIDIGEGIFPNTLWGTGTDDVYAMGAASGSGHNAFHWDGLSWSPVETHTVEGITGVFGAFSEVVAVGQAGMILRKSGAEFLPEPGGNIADLEAVWVSSDGSEAFAVGDAGTIVHFENDKWTSMVSGTTQNLRGLGGTCSCAMYAVGENGTVLKYDGNNWSDFSPGGLTNYNEVWVDASTGTAFLAGDGGSAIFLDNGIWVHPSLGVTENLLSVWGSSTTNVYFVGMDNSAFKWNGTQFKLVTVSPPPNVYNFHAVSGSGPGDVYVGGELLGIAPPLSPSANGENLHAGGAIFHWNGQAWTPVYTDPVSDVLAVWRANDHEGFATGDFASVVRNASSDNGWARVLDISNLPQRVNSVWGSSMKNVFIVGDDGAIVRYSP